MCFCAGYQQPQQGAFIQTNGNYSTQATLVNGNLAQPRNGAPTINGVDYIDSSPRSTDQYINGSYTHSAQVQSLRF